MHEERMIQHRASLTSQQRDVASWPKVDIQSLSPKNRKKFLNRLDAITRYMQGDKVADICSDCKMSQKQLYKLRDRCLDADRRDGDIRGLRGLIPWQRNAPYMRSAAVKCTSLGDKGGFAGAFTQFLDRYPSIRRYLVALFLRKSIRIDGDLTTRYRVLVPRDTYKSLNKALRKACIKKGVRLDEYPLCKPEIGYKGMIRFLKSYIDGPEMHDAILARFGIEAARKAGSGKSSTSRQWSYPYAVVEFDAYRIDGLWIIYVPNKHGGWDRFVLERIWILVIIERTSGAILGYSLCLTHNYSQFDVLRCIKNAIQPWKPIVFNIPTFKYPPGAGFPSGIISRCAWALWDLLVYDNAWANLATMTRNLLRNVVFSDVNPGPMYVRDHQAFIESFFKTHASTVHQRLPNTTGSHPKDIRRQNPERASLQFDMTFDDLKEIIELSLATYNITPRGAEQRSPLEILSIYAADENHIFKHLEENRRDLLFWFNYRVTRIVRGSLKDGRCPKIHFEGANYTNDLLHSMPSMIGQQLTFYVDPTADLRMLPAFLDNGVSFGMLEAQGEWSFAPHDLDLRRAINKARRQRKLFCTTNDDIVMLYLEHKEAEARRSKRSLNQYVKAKELQGLVRETVPSPSASPSILSKQPPISNPAGVAVDRDKYRSKPIYIRKEGRGDAPE